MSVSGESGGQVVTEAYRRTCLLVEQGCLMCFGKTEELEVAVGAKQMWIDEQTRRRSYAPVGD